MMNLNHCQGFALKFIENCLKFNIQPVFIKTDDFLSQMYFLHENTAGYGFHATENFKFSSDLQI